MRRSRLLISLLALLLSFLPALAQNDVPRENLIVNATDASTWSDGETNVIQLQGKVSIDLQDTHLSAQKAVIWLTPVQGAVLERWNMEVSLIGDAVISAPNAVERSGDTLYVTGAVRGIVRIAAETRHSQNLSQSDLYTQALAVRPQIAASSQPAGPDWLFNGEMPTTLPSTEPATQPFAPNAPVLFSAGSEEIVYTHEGLVAIVLDKEVKLIQHRPNGEIFEMQADRGVLFTPLKSLRDTGGARFRRIEEAITSAYLEGDVRIVHTPVTKGQTEQRMRCNRLYYDFTTDRAILTNAVIHSLEAKTGTPVTIRAQVVRQMSLNEYKVHKAVLSSSSFMTPSYHIGLDEAYVRETESGDPRIGNIIQFSGSGATFNAEGKPFFYLPYVAGTMTSKGQLIRNLGVKDSSIYGFSVETTWGLPETLGWIPNPDFDLSYRADWYTDRGPGVGLDSHYVGSFVNDTTRQPWSYQGDFTGYFVQDRGIDDLGRGRLFVVPPEQSRYRIEWAHQQFLPDDWQLQLTAGYISDPTFQEEWFQNNFDKQDPQQTSFYLKHQDQSQAFSLLYSYQPNKFVTNSDSLQEQVEVQREPEIAYHDIGESLLNDNLTLYSDNQFSGLKYRESAVSLAQQGFGPAKHSDPIGFQVGDAPGVPSIAQTGVTNNTVYRDDFREEFDYPLTLGQFRIVPYTFGRYTGYSDTPSGSPNDRVLGGGGIRISTAFWKVDDTVESDYFDLHRLRHVIEPELHLFGMTETTNRDRFFIYDENVDAVSSLTGAELDLNQRWQTKRGGPGQWRSVDVFSLDIRADLYARKPSAADLYPTNFRGLFFPSEPETSIARDAINSDASWRVSDNTIVLADAQYNLDHDRLATAAVGVAVQRDQRLSWYIGSRYIDLLNSNIATIATNYEISPKYTVALSQSYDFGQAHDVGTGITFIRHFDRFYLTVSYSYDAASGTYGYGFNLVPEDLGKQANIGTSKLKGIFQ